MKKTKEKKFSIAKTIIVIIVILIAVLCVKYQILRHQKYIIQQGNYQYMIPATWSPIKESVPETTVISPTMVFYTMTRDTHYQPTPKAEIADAYTPYFGSEDKQILFTETIENRKYPVVHISALSNFTPSVYVEEYRVLTPYGYVSFQFANVKKKKFSKSMLSKIDAIIDSVSYIGDEPNDYTQTTVDNEYFSLSAPDSYYIANTEGPSIHMYPIQADTQAMMYTIMSITPFTDDVSLKESANNWRNPEEYPTTHDEHFLGQYDAYIIESNNPSHYTCSTFYFIETDQHKFKISLYCPAEFREEMNKEFVEYLKTVDFH